MLRSKSPEADYLAEVWELTQDSGRLHRNSSAVRQLHGASCYRPAIAPVGDRLAALGSPTRREGEPARGRGAVTGPGVIKPLVVPTWRRSAQLHRGGQDMAAIELSS